MMAEYASRNNEMRELHRDGMRAASIARRYGVSRERVRQIIGNTTGRRKGKRVNIFDGSCECLSDFHYPGFPNELAKLRNQFRRDGHTFYMERSCNHFLGSNYEVLGETKHWKAIKISDPDLKKYFARDISAGSGSR